MAAAVDPRANLKNEADVRPIVAKPVSNAPIWIFGTAVIVAAMLLFSTLDAHRRELGAPATKVRASDLAQMPASPPALYIPPDPATLAGPGGGQVVSALPIPSPPQSFPQPLAPSPRIPIPQRSTAFPTPPQSQPERSLSQSGPAVVLDSSTNSQALIGPGMAGGSTVAAALATAANSGQAAQAGLSRQGATTVPQGTLIPAVLETALDSTRPGQTRALVSRDVRGFDGTRVLIPRGSRLFGLYQADLAPGQNRALVQWTRLVRPDGVSIAIDSPAADSLGRAGVKGQVNSHFFERFGSAILQSTLDLGVNLAARSVGSGAYIYVPGATIGNVVSSPQSRPVQSTLKVNPGARVSVFVARDLDFSTVSSAP